LSLEDLDRKYEQKVLFEFQTLEKSVATFTIFSSLQLFYFFLFL